MKRHITLNGDYAGEPFKPLNWFLSAMRAVYGPRTEEGLRQIESVYTEVAKGNAKTMNVAALMVTELCLADQSGTEFVSAATVKKQAANTYDAAEQIVLNDPYLKRRLALVPSKKLIYRRDNPTCKYQALSSDGDNNDGCIPQMVILDEVHVWRTKKNRQLYTILTKSAKAKRKNPLIWAITTAGVLDEGALGWEMHQYAESWLMGAVINKKYYGAIYAADPKKIEADPNYWKSKEARLSANPAHVENGGYIKDEVFVEQILEAEEKGPIYKAEYMRYSLNYWGANAESVLDFPTWLRNMGPDNLMNWPTYDWQYLVEKWDLKLRDCWLGIDCGQNRDLTALSAVFPPTAARDRWAILSWQWMPRCEIKNRERKDQVPYTDWVEKGFIFAHDEPKTNPLIMVPFIKKLMDIFEVQEICYDKYNAQTLICRIENGILEGDDKGTDALNIPCWDIKQDYAQLNEPLQWLIRAYQHDELMHGSNPVLNWNARNLGADRNKDGLMKPIKVTDDDPKKIDGMAAVITALRRALVVIGTDTAVNVR